MSSARLDKAFNPGSTVSVGVADQALVSANPNRQLLILQNNHATQNIFLSFGGTAALDSGGRLNAAGGSLTIDCYTGAVRAIGSGASTGCVITEL